MQLEDPTPKLYGLLAEFDSATAIVNAAREARRVGYVNVDAYTPFPIHELDSALAISRTRLPWLVLGGGITGMLAGFGLEYWTSVVDYPLNVGGRPYASWPAFVVPAYETTILFAAITAVVGMILLNGLPQPYHPLFNAPNFSNATADRFFLCIEAVDPKFDVGATRQFLQGLKPIGVSDVVD
jgi:Protein of unknown function (DUF3341)